MTECLLNGERCFLEQQAWQEVMKSIIDKEESPISDRSEIVLSLLMLKCRIPGFCYEVTDIICVAPDPDVEAIEDLAIRLRQLRTNFLNWRSRYQSIVGCFPEMSPGCLDYDSHCKVWANFLSCSIITTRLLEALCAAERPELEQTTESLITQMFQLELETRNSPTSLFMAQTFAVAQATNVTSDDWKEVKPVIVDDQPDTKGLIERSKFERWNKMIGRKLP
jgi:FtsZ-binding cell division protein ZapB